MTDPKTKRCLLFVVDALTESIVREWVEDGKLPSITKVLAKGGRLLPCTSIFPSITPAATCSIATGVYPKQHGIEGACWFDPVTNDAAYFGDDYKLAKREGLYQYLVDFGDRLNFERLRAPLIYEHLYNVKSIPPVSTTCGFMARTFIHERRHSGCDSLRGG